MRQIFRDNPSACDNTLLIAERCDVEFNTSANYMPRFPVPDGGTEDSWFVKEIEKGLKDVVEEVVFPHPALDFLKNPALIDLGMLVMRVVTASLIFHHGLDKLQHVEGFSTNVIAAYFPFLPGPPTFWTYLSAGFEIVGSFCITFGLFVRPAAALLAGTMVNAIAFQLMKFGLQNYPFGQPPSGPAYTFEPSLAFLAVCARIATAGPGQFGLQTCCRPVLPVTPRTPGDLV